MSNSVRVRVAVAVVQDSQIILVPHYNTGFGPLTWYLPGGGVEFGENIKETARREFLEETGFEIDLGNLVDITEIINIGAEKPWHSITLSYSGVITGGKLRGEPNHPYGDKTPRWFSQTSLTGLTYHPAKAIERAFELD